MMIKQIWVAQCDICGKMEETIMNNGQYNEKTPILPYGWKCGHNTKIHYCEDCAHALTAIKQVIT